MRMDQYGETLILPTPGSDDGPCKGSCNHLECLTVRSMAGQYCCYCALRIGFGVRVVRSPLAHYRCVREHELKSQQFSSLRGASQETASLNGEGRVHSDEPSRAEDEGPAERRSAWERFRTDEDLQRRYRVTPQEMQILSQVAFLGEVESPNDFVLVLETVRKAVGRTKA